MERRFRQSVVGLRGDRVQVRIVGRKMAVSFHASFPFLTNEWLFVLQMYRQL